MLDADVRDLAVARSLGVFTTLMPGGQPQTSLVWPHADETHLLVSTGTGRQKFRNVSEDPRVNLLLLDSANGRRYIEVRGRVVGVVHGEDALSVARVMFTKWTGSPAVRPSDGERVVLRIESEHVHRKE